MRRISEEKTRKQMIDPQLEHAGWSLRDHSKVKTENPVDGYDAEHYELSMQVGELGVLPKIRRSMIDNRESDTLSSGAACRMQIQHGAGVEAKHPLELVRERLKAENLSHHINS